MEELMQYVWLHRLWPPGVMHTVDGRALTVIDPGRLNTGSGPDFFNAKVKIGDQMWAGDVEIHVRASDWHRHGHDGDRAYDTVVLHVVGRDDVPIRRRDGEIIPQLLMPCSPTLREKYAGLVSRAELDMPCAAEIALTSSLHIGDWMTSLLLERLYDKVDRINKLLKRTSGDWETVCFATVARGLGFGINAEPMERLAMSLPLPILFKHSDSRLALEALMLGRAGLLDDVGDNLSDDSYPAMLKREYLFLAAKFGLSPCDSFGWKTARMRPGNSPCRRIAMLAAMVYGGFRMLADIIAVTDDDSARRLFSTEIGGYWASHNNLNSPASGADSPALPSRLSRASIDSLVINVVAPVIMAYGLAHGDDDAPARAVALLEQLPPESNYIVTMMERAGLKARDAASTQALIQLRRCYCEARKCLYCRLGHRLMGRWAVGKG